MSDDDEVEAEYPLYAASLNSFFVEPQRLLLLDYPLRPAWRPYQTEQAVSAKYKQDHKMMELTVPQDGQEAHGKTITLTGQGEAPEALLCTMVKIGDGFALLPVDEVVQMRPDMKTYDAKEEAAAKNAREEYDDPEYKPPEAKPTAKQLKTVKVEVQKRETERQLEARMRSHAHLREGREKEEWLPLKVHGSEQGNSLLVSTCRRIPGNVPTQMAMSAAEYLRIISPATWIGSTDSGQPTKTEPAAAAVTKLEPETLREAQKALEKLFHEQPVVSLADVRSWLSNCPAHPLARPAAAVSDATLHGLLTGGGSIRCVKGRYVIASCGNPALDAFRDLVLEHLEEAKTGVRKADIMAAAQQAGLGVTEHMYSKVLKELCVAQGALWSIKPGASF